MIRVVIDASDAPADASFAALSEALFDAAIAVAPPRIALVLTEAHRAKLSARFARHEALQVVIVRDADGAWERVERLASAGAVVVSQRRYRPLLHWVAVTWTPALELSPADGLSRWRDGLALDDVPAAASLRDVALLVESADAAMPPASLREPAVKLRALLAALSYGREVLAKHDGTWIGTGDTPIDAKTRLAWAKALDVPAIATPAEWATLLLERAKEFGVGVIALGDEVELEAQRARVARGASPNRAVVVGGALHLVNVPDELRAQLTSMHGVFFHEVTARVSGFDRVQALALSHPAEAWLDDPFVDRALTSVDPQGADRDELEFARASLLLHDRLAPRAAPRRRDWRAHLAEALAHDPPPVALRVPPTVRHDGVTTVMLPHREVDRRASQRGKELVGVRAIAEPRIDRDDGLVTLTAATERVGGGEWNAWIAQRRFLLPTGRAVDDEELRVDLFVRAPSRNALTPDLLRWWNQNPDDHQLGLFWPSTVVPFAEGLWRDADRDLAMLWIALRRALAKGLDVTLADGTGVLELGGGHVAEVCATDRSLHASGALDAAFVCAFDGAPPLTLDRHAWTRRSDRHGPAIPRALDLAHGDVRLRVTLLPTPWDAPAR